MAVMLLDETNPLTAMHGLLSPELFINVPRLAYTSLDRRCAAN